MADSVSVELSDLHSSLLLDEPVVVASGLRYPLNPIWIAGDVLLILESARGTLSVISPDGDVGVLAELGGAPTSAAIGPDHALYVCNNGGVTWSEVDGFAVPGEQSNNYTGGKIQKVDLNSGQVEVLYDEVDGIRLRGPHDIAFDSSGGFWFTDAGKLRSRERDRGGLFYAKADGSSVEAVVYPLDAPTGICLSPNEDILYMAESQKGRIYWWPLVAPGRISGYFGRNHRGTLLADPEGGPIFGSMTADGIGNVCVATTGNGGITTVTPDGLHRHRRFASPMVTSLAFGGDNRQTMYATESGTGEVVACEWEYPGGTPIFGPKVGWPA